MKPIRLSKNFDKHYKQRVAPIKNLRDVYAVRVLAFQSGERGYPLKDHALRGELSGIRSFSIAGDVRVVYEEAEDAIVFLDIGSHNQVYK